MTHYLVGSRALEYWGTGFTAGPSSDWDIICPKDEAHIWEKYDDVDVTFLEDLYSEEILKSCMKYAVDSKVDFTEVHELSVLVAPLSALMIMKRSHLWRDLNWEKHITQYHFELLPRCSFVKPSDFLVKERAKLTKEKYPQPHPDLSKSNEEFFDDAVKKDFDHDWIHELVAYGKRPMFEKLKHKGGEDSAWCSKDLWDKLTHEERLKCVAEEAHVIACERFLIPSNWTHNWWGAYMKAVKKVCTTLCSGYFRDYAIDYYPQVVDKYDMSKMRLVQQMTKGV